MRPLLTALRRRLIRPTGTLEGYEQPELVEVIFQKTKAYEPQGTWPEMVDTSSVLDFGGGCGLHYKQARSPNIRWAVVETQAMVERASELTTERLQFFTNIRDAAGWIGTIDVVHSNGALQYAPDPEQSLAELCSLRASKMLWYRTSLSNKDTEREMQSSRLSDNGPGSLPSIKQTVVKYICTKIPESLFLDAHRDYELIKRNGDFFSFVLR